VPRAHGRRILRHMDAPVIDALLARAVEVRAVPGVVAVTGDRYGVRYEGAFGLLSLDGDLPCSRTRCSGSRR
jgi:hypothetical protein